VFLSGPACGYFLFEMLELFAVTPDLESFELSCDVALETNEFSVPLLPERGHHLVSVTRQFALRANGGQSLFESPEEEYMFLGERLPRTLLGKGLFSLERNDPAVQEYLQLNENEVTKLHRLLADLSYRMVISFGSVTVVELAIRADDFERKQPSHAVGTPLNPGEHEILQLAASGLSSSQIAALLGIGERTVQSRLKTLAANLNKTNHD